MGKQENVSWSRDMDCPTVSCKTLFYHFPPLLHPTSRPWSFDKPLQTSKAVLLIDVPVPLLLLPVLEDHCNAQDEERIYTDNAECGGEDQIEILVRETREGSNAATLLRSNE